MRTNGLWVRLAVAATLACAGGAWLSADTLRLRDGRRVDGELIGMRNGVLEFRERGYRDDRILRIPRSDVRSIELEDGFDEYGSQPPVERMGRPRGLREREVVVSADVAWNDSGIELRAGQEIYFESRGNVWWGPGRKDGPAGERNSPHNPNRPIPNRPGASLIGKVGNASGDAFFIGDSDGPMRVRSSGRLFLGVNDDMLQDNRGNFRVTVYY